MEQLLIILAIVVIDALVKRVNAKKKAEQQQHQAPTTDSTQEFEEEQNDEDFDERADDQATPPPRPFVARKLQEYIKQFEEAQREASQGTMESPMPPPVPESKHSYGDNVTLREVAENIVQLDVVDVEYLMDEFDMSEGTAIAMLNELQQYRVIGRDMGDGEYDVLVQDIDELNNLLSRERAMQMAAEKAADIPTPAHESAQSPTASDKQSQLKILEERARKAREEASAAALQSDFENGYAGDPAEMAASLAKRTVRSISKESVRRGFIWGKIIDEPRFKKRWSPVSR